MVAEEIYNYIQGGGKELKKAFHLGSRLSRRLQQVVQDRLMAIRSRKAELDRQVLDAIRVQPEKPLLTGILVTHGNQRLLE